jgi:hypothetical protein
VCVSLALSDLYVPQIPSAAAFAFAFAFAAAAVAVGGSLESSPEGRDEPYELPEVDSRFILRWGAEEGRGRGGGGSEAC